MYAISTTTSRIVTFLGDELRSNSNLKCPKYRGMVTSNDVISATWAEGSGIRLRGNIPTLCSPSQRKKEEGQ
jgi:hypothetical protein